MTVQVGAPKCAAEETSDSENLLGPGRRRHPGRRCPAPSQALHRVAWLLLGRLRLLAEQTWTSLQPSSSTTWS